MKDTSASDIESYERALDVMKLGAGPSLATVWPRSAVVCASALILSGSPAKALPGALFAGLLRWCARARQAAEDNCREADRGPGDPPVALQPHSAVPHRCPLFQGVLS